ncbi:MAG TPA: outer membrane protein assembly factor BamD [Candidatus Polarisedimenticolaceae bacterium]|nr:outer membrane protein assembly factor BamD [Candidatus Polarisedimenticolaceae bacterium]
MTRRTIACVMLASIAITGCAGKKKKAQSTAEVLTAEQTLARADDAMARHQLRKAKNLLQGIQFTQAERPTYEPLVRLGLADATYYLGDDLSLIEARSKYLDFVTLYADHPRAPYAQFQAGMCSVKQIYTAARDQAQTRVAIDDFAEIDKRWPQSPYGRAARQFVGKGQDVLAEHEFVVGTFYRTKQAYAAAAQRFKHLLETYPTYRAKDKVYYWLGWTMTHASDTAGGRVWLDQVMNEYPRSKYASMAQKLLADEAKQDAKKPKTE